MKWFSHYFFLISLPHWALRSRVVSSLPEYSLWLCSGMVKLIVLVAKSCPTLCGPMDCSPGGSSVHGILQAKILEWVASPFSRGSFQPRVWTWVCHIGSQILYCLSRRGSPPGSSAHGIRQARILEWAAVFSSRGSSSARDQTQISYGCCIAGRFFTTEPPGKPT